MPQEDRSPDFNCKPIKPSEVPPTPQEQKRRMQDLLEAWKARLCPAPEEVLDFSRPAPSLAYPDLLLACKKHPKLALKVRNPDEHILRFAVEADPSIIGRKDFPEQLRLEIREKVVLANPHLWRTAGYTYQELEGLCLTHGHLDLIAQLQTADRRDTVRRHIYERTDNRPTLEAIEAPTEEERLLLALSDSLSDLHEQHNTLLAHKDDPRVLLRLADYMQGAYWKGQDEKIVAKLAPLATLLSPAQKKAVVSYMDNPRQYPLTKEWCAEIVKEIRGKPEEANSSKAFFFLAGAVTLLAILLVLLGTGVLPDPRSPNP